MVRFRRKKMKYKIFWGIFILLLTVILSVLLMLTPVGSFVFKNVIESKIDKYIPGAEITYLDYGVNNFSLGIKKGENFIKVFGAMVPLNAMYEGDINNLSDFSKYFRGKMNISGKLFSEKGEYVLDGLAFFADGYMNYRLGINEHIFLKAAGKDFDIQKIFYMLKIKYPWIAGKSDFYVNKKKQGPYYIKIDSKGEYSKRIYSDFAAKSEIVLKSPEEFMFKSGIKSDVGNIFLHGRFNSGRAECSFNVKSLDLSKLKPVLLYPFHKKIDVKGTYDFSNGVFKFKGNDFEGFCDTRFEITFKTDADKFFDYLGILKLLKGNISGTLKIYDNFGTFDIVSDNTVFLKNAFTKRLYRITGVDLSKEKTGKVFFKGRFDSKKAVFDMLSTNQNVSISVKKGKFYYPGGYDFILYLRKNNDIYKIKINKKEMRVLEKRNFREKDNKVLVF
ncbi:hypothetical protein [Nautilia sp.]